MRLAGESFDFPAPPFSSRKDFAGWAEDFSLGDSANGRAWLRAMPRMQPHGAGAVREWGRREALAQADSARAARWGGGSTAIGIWSPCHFALLTHDLEVASTNSFSVWVG